MSTFTKEQLIEKLQHRISVASGFPESEKAQMDLELARIALASLEAEPAIHRWRRVTAEPYGPYPWHYGNFICFSKPVDGIEDEYYYAAQPAPVSVPDERYQHLSELYHAQEKRLFKLAQRIKGASFDKYAYSPSQAIDVLESAIFGEREDECRAAMLQGADGNSPVIPDGYALVPIEPTTKQWAAGMQAFEYGMDKVTRVYKAMIAAAPQQE
ncbi:TPA: hypothetical protein ACTYM0_002506 [Enterobacter hormaechei]